MLEKPAPDKDKKSAPKLGYRASIKRLPSEQFLAIQAAVVDVDDNAVIPISSHVSREKYLWKYLIVSIGVMILSIFGFIYGYEMDQNIEPKVYNNTVYAFLFLILCNLFIILDYTDKWQSFQCKFERQAFYYMISFLIIAFIDYILIGLSEDGLIKGVFVIVIIEVLYYLALILFFCTFMAYWKSWSFHCSGKAWIHALLYLSVIGAILIFICRWLHPPPNNSNEQQQESNNNNVTFWHKKHNIRSILTSIISIITLLFLFCVVLGGIGICLFSEFATYSQQFGLELAFICFVIMSFVIMLTPLAPGSIIDACGGFIFIILLVPDHMGFFAAWGVAVVTVVILHYCGACIQWWMGTWRGIQVWGNTNLPVEMLAASDAVLRDANWIEVGLVAYIFLDTANGLNQGRINMEFWTQLFSEWPAIPNALGLVSFGATVAAPAVGLNNIDWTADAVPLLIIFSTVVQAIGFTFGTREMAASVDKKEYWCSREKWEMMHHFKKQCGYIPTIEGWKHDVFNLGNNVNNVDGEFKSILYDKVVIVHNEYVSNRNKLKDAQKRLNLYKKYLTDLVEIREKHYNEFSKYLEKAMDKKWLIYEEPTIAKRGYFDVEYDDDEIIIEQYDNDNNNNKRELPPYKKYLQYILVTILVITFWASFYGFYWTSDLAETVTGGLDILRNIEWYWYMALFTFLAILIFINHVEIISNAKSLCSAIHFVFTGCKIHPDIETKFETPKWIPSDRKQYGSDQDIEKDIEKDNDDVNKTDINSTDQVEIQGKES